MTSLKTLCGSAVLLLIFSNMNAIAAADPKSGPLPSGLQVYPVNNIWNVPIDKAPVHPNSAMWMDIINGHSGHPLHADFGYMYQGHFNGIPYNIVGNATPKVAVIWDPAGNYAADSDALPPGGLPIPVDAVAEGDPAPVDMSGDRHLLLLDTDNKVLHELYAVTRQSDGSWLCRGYAHWDLTSNALRPDGLSSADAAGLPILPGLVRWYEIQTGAINHALRFTLALTWRPHLWPARHDAVSGSTLNPPMGMRVRLKANFDISGYSATNQVILKALKKYGMFLADNGSDWFVSGAPNANFNDDDLHLLTQIVPEPSVRSGRHQRMDGEFQFRHEFGHVAAHQCPGGRGSLGRTRLSQPLASEQILVAASDGRSAPVERGRKGLHLVRAFSENSSSLRRAPLFGISRAIPGDQVASGIYLYSVTTPDGQKTRGKIGIIK